ncbi:uncharacterized protein LOC119585615 [Penaeus monodon]|uniref:uncharacterized protein LOC119585615 n=1 Tax=Penaeus monodon TaxID=6687 RepID=UPI0018A70882|nr:uncharacterized protein LOC119585615 [Penaeus monodon]
MDGGSTLVAGAAAVVGQMSPCYPRGKNKHFKKWTEWIADAVNKIIFLAMNSDQKLVCAAVKAHIRFNAFSADKLCTDKFSAKSVAVVNRSDPGVYAHPASSHPPIPAKYSVHPPITTKVK